MNRFDKSTEVMHDLLLIQNDRKAVYEKIVAWPGIDESICNHIKKIIRQCRNCIMELRGHVDMTGSDPADKADIRGELYHEWPGISDFTPNNSIPEIIESLESKEKEVALAYQKALQCEDNLRQEFRTLISDQLSIIHRSFGSIVERKEQPGERVMISEEEKPFVILRDRVFLETSVHSRAFDMSER
jgi:uncharacterized protein (TIGR02284 family)